MNNHVSLQPDPKSQPATNINQTLFLIKTRIAYQNKSHRRKVSSIFQNTRGNRNTRPIPFSLQTSSGKNLHVRYVGSNTPLQTGSEGLYARSVELNTPLQTSGRALRRTHKGLSTLPTRPQNTRSLHATHGGFSAPFPRITRSLHPTHRGFSALSVGINHRYVGFSRTNPRNYASISSVIAGRGSDSSPPKACIAAS
jgi:hypothetical protein